MDTDSQKTALPVPLQTVLLKTPFPCLHSLYLCGQVLWLQSPNSEVWLNRRTLYARSLAAMSIVGYILGLGDRHPNNLMLQRLTGKVVHIDFGDCFEVCRCMLRKFVEGRPTKSD